MAARVNLHLHLGGRPRPGAASSLPNKSSLTRLRSGLVLVTADGQPLEADSLLAEVDAEMLEEASLGEALSATNEALEVFIENVT